jgi:hypothetical protein
MTIGSITSTASQIYDDSSFASLSCETGNFLNIVFPRISQLRIGREERADQSSVFDGRIPFGILTANMTVLRCHFASKPRLCPYGQSASLGLGRRHPAVSSHDQAKRDDYSSSSMSIAARASAGFLAVTGLGRRTLIDAASRVLLMCAA